MVAGLYLIEGRIVVLWTFQIKLADEARWRKMAMPKSESIMLGVTLKTNNTIRFLTIELEYITIFVNVVMYTF